MLNTYFLRATLPWLTILQYHLLAYFISVLCFNMSGYDFNSVINWTGSSPFNLKLLTLRK